MLRDVFYFGSKPNAHPREQYAESLIDARQKATTRDFWIINEFCDYRNFDWDFDFEFLPDEDVWAEDHNNVWPSQHQKDSGTWLCPKEHSDLIIYRADVDPVIRKNEKQSENWVELDLIDHTKFDFSWHPDPTDPPYIYKWGCKFFPAQLKHVLEYRVPGATQEKYMDTIVELLPEPDRWVEVQAIDKTHFDMSWRPSPLDTPYIYIWGNKYIDGRLKSTLEYHCEGATDKKYMPELLPVLPEWDRWVEVQEVDKKNFDFSWRPDPREPAYIYTWGNKYIDAELRPTLEYHCEGATDRKYLTNDVPVLPEKDRWKVIKKIEEDSFDFSWRPDPREPPMTYVFGNDLYDAVKMPTVIYTMPEGHDTKYVDDIKAKLAPVPENYEHLEDSYLLDYTWQPDPDSPPFIYVWGNQWNKPEDKISVQYVVEGATEYKYMDERAIRRPCTDNWLVPDNIDLDGFDLSWEPDAGSPPYIYEFATVWNNRGGPRYVVPGATKFKFIEDVKAKTKPVMNCWQFPDKLDLSSFDFSWVPHPDDPPYVYEFGTQWQKTGGPRYVLDGATEVKYVEFQKATKLPSDENWKILGNIATNGFDFSWHPDSNSPPYVYVFGNQWNKAVDEPTVEYHTPGATQVKYIDSIVATLAPDRTNWNVCVPIDENKFDFTWRPNPTSPPYIYVWGNKYVAGKYESTVEYIVPGATEKHYMHDNVEVTPEWDRWEIPDNLDTSDIDFTWRPDPLEPAFIYELGTQWQKTGGPRYVVPGATEVKYLDLYKAKKLPNKDDSNWHVCGNYLIAEFDYSWHPDTTDEPYIYVFGNQWFSAEKDPTIEYRMPNATERKYVNDIVATLGTDMTNWYVPDNVDTTDFDFSWHPDPGSPPYIYEFATIWNNRGGPRYIVPEATKFKFIEDIKAKTKPVMNCWQMPDKIDLASFDFSWVPHPDDPPYIYEFGTQWQKTGGPRYVLEGATETKYVEIVATRLASKDENWYTRDGMRVKNFDYSWHPDSTEEPYIYVFGNQWNTAEKEPTVEYRVPGATAYKYIIDIVAVLEADMRHWDIPSNIDTTGFDFSWRPDPYSPPYIYEFGTQWQKTGGPRYVVEGATTVKYIDKQKAKIVTNNISKNFVTMSGFKIESFDYSWHPDSTEEPYIYVFGNQWNTAEVEPTIEYRMPGATEKKYIDTNTAKLTPNMTNWELPNNIDVTEFDFSWRPNPGSPPYIYEFGTQWQKTGGPKLVMPNATEVKYIDSQKAKALPNKDNFKTIIDATIDVFDYSWHPDSTEEPYIYVFGNTQYPAEEMPTIEYRVKDATIVKYVNDTVASLKPNMSNWKVSNYIDQSSFDFSWLPHPKAPPYIYEFATVWNDRGGPVYHVPNATEYKYIEDIKANTLPNMTNWEIPNNVDVNKFDFSWLPHPKAPPYIYQFGTKLNNNDGPRYNTPGNNGEVVYLERVETDETPEISVAKYYIETTLEDLVNQHPNEIFWAVRKNIDYTDFDFMWRPGTIEVAWELEYVHVFGSMDSELTQTYFVSADHYLAGNTSFKFVEEIKLDETILSQIFIKPDMFYVDRGNSDSAERFERLKARFGNKIQKTRYLNSWVDTINRCINRSTTEVLWVLNSELDYANFDFEYYPNPWQMKMVHVFGTQWNHWGTTFMVNRETFTEDTKYIKIIEHLSNLNFVKNIRAKATQCVHDIVLIDHGNTETESVLRSLVSKAGNRTVTTVKYQSSYFDTIKKIIAQQQAKKENFIWVCSSVCDYSDFDFSYVIDPFSRDNLHVFPSGMQKFGDTFFFDVNQTQEIIDQLENLEEHKRINFNQTIKTQRLPEPIIVVGDDTHTNAIQHVEGFPYATLITHDNQLIDNPSIEPMNLWSPERKNIIVTSTGATRIIVPQEAKDYVKKELYDYPYIKRSPKLLKSNPLDIVFLSNGETGAEENWEHLLKVTENLPNRVVRVDGVNGRAKAYHAAAEASETPWMFTVFAKLKVNNRFDWNWQPDRMQVPKHYIFHAKNPVNGLTYGHQAMIAYNKKLTLANEGRGLDFTLDDEHEIVPLVSGTAIYNTDPFSTWRTAFREVIKLKADTSEESQERLNVWLTVADGDYSEYSIKGAVDASNYYDQVEGDFDKLKLSYEWAWLQELFNKS